MRKTVIWEGRLTRETHPTVAGGEEDLYYLDGTPLGLLLEDATTDWSPTHGEFREYSAGVVRLILESGSD